MEDKEKDKSFFDIILENEDPRTGKPWYVRYKHLLGIIAFAVIWGAICAIWSRYSPY